MTKKYSPQKHEWGTKAATDHAKSMTPGEKEYKKEKKVTKGKTFFQFREKMQSAAKKPEVVHDPRTKKTITRMVPVNKDVSVVPKDK